MSRYVDLCIAQYYAEVEKAKMEIDESATKLCHAARMAYCRNMSDIMKFAKSGEEAKKMSEEFENAIHKHEFAR